MNKSLLLLSHLLVTLIFIPALVEAATPISTLGSATANNNFDNGNFQQQWTWNSLTGTAFVLSSSTNNATAGAQALLSATLSGANINSGVTSITGDFTSTHTGTNSTNYAVRAVVGGGSHNYGVFGQVNGSGTGDSGVWGKSLQASGVNYGVYGTNASSAGYGGYFENSGGGYAGAFLGGNVGIGTVTPNYPFHVTGANASGPVAYYDQTDNSNKVAIFHKSSTNNQGIIVGNSTDGATNGQGFHIGYFSNGGNYGYLDAYDWGAGAFKNLVFNQGQFTIVGASGNVGIGNSSPAYTLQVNGSVAGTSAYVNTSDARLKKNVKPLPYGLKEVEQLKPVSFEWKNAKDIGMKGQQIGFVAQDVEQVLPSVVLTMDDADKTKSMKYTEIIPVLVKAVQELKADNDNQTKEINALQQDFDVYKQSHP